MLPNVGPLELIVVAVIALIVLGPKRLPTAGKSLGRGMRELRQAISASAEEPALPASPAEREERG